MPRFAPQGNAAAPAPPSPSFSVNGARAADQTPRPKFRGQSSDAAQPATPLSMPTPEALGLSSATAPTSAAPVEVDWNDVRSRLRRLGAVGFHLDQVAADQWRATFLVPMGPEDTRHVEASAANDAAAVSTALLSAEKLMPRP